MHCQYFLTFWLLANSALAPAAFTDATATSKIGFVFASGKTPDRYLIEAMGGGVAMFDADGDGRLDLFFVNGAALKPGMGARDRADKSEAKYWNRLYRNQGDGTFADITEKAGLRGNGYGQGVAVGDVDNDGRADLFVTALGGNTLYRNLGGGAFEDVTAQAGLAGGGWSTSAGFIDYDRDGSLDLFVARYLDWDFDRNKRCGGAGPALQSYCHPNEYGTVTHLLYRGLGGCRFADVSGKAGIARAPGKGLGVAFADVDRDGWPDIFVANDSYPQQLFRNQQDGTFAEIALAAGAAYDEDGKVFAGMGVDLADYDNDGFPDVFVNALANQGYGLFRNRKGLFEYVSGASGITLASQMHSGWGTRFLDYDNDGWKDLFVAQGHVMDNIELTQPGIRYRETPLLLRNAGGRFADVSARAGAPFGQAMAGRGAAFGDFNNDGAVDIVVSDLNGAPRVFRNGATANNWLLVDTVGAKSNRDGLGATVRIVMASGSEQTGFVSTAGSYLSAHDKRVHFGLGAERQVKLLEIRWPGGALQTWKNVAANQIFVAREAAP
ncbi:MAG: CRTAC1 family protein [Blastocatellia bacterium]